MDVIPSIDLRAGRSRLVFWPGAASGTGTPTDRPERIARHFVELGAPAVHLVDLDGAQRGVPVATEAIAAVARAVAVPLQVAGGIDGARQIELAFAAGATRVVMPVWRVAEDEQLLDSCLAIASNWLAIGVDARPERMRDYPWRGAPPATLPALLGRLLDRGVQRVVVSHWEMGGLRAIAEFCAARDAELQLAGGVNDIGVLAELAAMGIGAVLLGEALFTGAVDYQRGLRLRQRAVPVTQPDEV